MNEPEAQGAKVDLLRDVLDAIDSPLVLLTLGSALPEISLVNYTAQLEGIRTGQSLASLCARLRLDETTRTSVLAAAHAARAGTWTSYQDDDGREVSLRPLPRREPHPQSGILAWGRLQPTSAVRVCAIAGQLAIATASEARAVAEASAREREQFLNGILDGSPVGIQIFGPDGESRRCNAAQQRLLDMGDAASLQALAASTRADAADAFLRCKDGGPVTLERRVANGYPRDLDKIFFPVRGHTGAMTAVVQFTLDVSERVKQENARQKLEAKLRESQKLEAVGQLASGVAHDFNNILTAVLGFAGVLRDTTELSDPSRDLIAQILQAADRGAELTRQLLAFGRRQVMRAEVFDAAANVLDLEPMLRRLLDASVQLVVDAPTVGYIQADRRQFEQVLLNLVVNARDAMPHGGVLSVEVASTGSDDGVGTVSVRVIDTGIGMSPEIKARLFEPLFTTKKEGTGFGLATVYGIVTQSGGTIRVDSAPGAGATFEVTWPCAQPMHAASTAPPGAATPGARRGRILVVEDDAPNRHLTVRLLSTQGHSVMQAASAEEALAIVSRDPTLDMLVTDVAMPGMSGRILAQRLLAKLPTMRVLFVSGYLTEEATRLDTKRVELLQKPFSSGELAAAVERLLTS